MKVGDYVRLDRCQGINRIDEIDEIGTFYLEDVIGDEWGDETFRLDTNDVIKSSPNIIDLIGVGDYVNGSEVMSADWINENGEYEEGLAFPMYAEDDLHIIVNWLPLKYVEIHSIVTKEQFSQMEYRIEE